MSATAKIVELVKDYVQAEDREMLRLTLHVLQGKKRIDVCRFHLPLDTTDRQLKAYVKKFINQYNAELENKIIETEKAKVNKKTDTLIKSNTGLTIK